MNNTFRLFVSSTFSDFIKERAILNNEIFEKIESIRQEMITLTKIQQV